MGPTAVEGLAKKGLVRDRDYKILYGVGNSPARAQALESGKIHASPFSFLERLELEKKGFPVLFDIGSVLPGFPFVVIVTRKQKIETDPDGIVAILRGIHRGQVRAMWRWARDLDASNALINEFAIPPGIASGSAEDYRIRREEGWILGCSG